METISRKHAAPHPAGVNSRRAFTMVELLVVVLIIAILIALLVPAIAGAIKTVNAGRCTADINSLVAALAQFKSTYSDYPPSRIVINENGYYNTNIQSTVASAYLDGRADISYGTLEQRSARYLQKFFPRATVFNTVSPASAHAYDINGNGTSSDVFMLTGDECLVFFLGGLANFTTGSSGEQVIGMAGFARDPSNPFNRVSTSRTQPLFQFQGGRLVDPDQDGFPSYLDTYGGADPASRSYAYFSSYGGGNYDPNDCDTSTHADPYSPIHWVDPHASDDSFARAFSVTFPVNSAPGNSCYTYPAATSVSSGPNPYTASAPSFAAGGKVVWQNNETFQIISAGSDQLFGIGGSFSTTANAGTLAYPDAGGMCGVASVPSRSAENDNLTNFYNSRLQ